MKTHFHQFTRVAIAGLVLASASLARAQTTSVTSTTTTSSEGTVSNFTPDSMVVQTTSSASPVTYSYTKTTTYVDENGNPVAVETVRSGLPVTVYYSPDGDRFVANKVVVRKVTTTTAPDPAPTVIEKKTTTTTTTTSSTP
jgi:hypothetical protein